MNTLTIVLAAIKGFFTPGTTAGAEIVSVVLAFISTALNNLNSKTKANITKCLNIATFALKWLHKVENWIPVKWQCAYRETIEAVEVVIRSLEDFKITDEEFALVKKEFEEARIEWESDDDETVTLDEAKGN